MARRLNKRLLILVLIFVGVPVALLAFGFYQGWFSGGDPLKAYEEAKQYADAGDWTAAWTAVGNATRGEGAKNPEALFLRARVALKQKPPAGGLAIKCLRDTLSLKPDYVEAQRMLAEIYVGARYWKEARTECARLMQLDPSYGKGYLWAAVVELQQAESEPLVGKRAPFYEATAKFCKAGIEKAPDLLDLYRILGQAYERLGQESKIDEVVDLALAKNPTMPEAYIFKAARLNQQKKLDKAIDVLKKGVEKIGENPRLLLALGDMAERKKDPDMAREYFAKAVAADPKNEASYIRLASLHRSDNEREKALAVLSQGMAQLPESTILRAEQADIYMELGNFPKADEVIGEIEKAAPGTAAVSYLRGRRALASRQTRVAITYLEQAKEKQATPLVRLLLGRAYLLADELGAARSELESLVQDVPGMTPAWRSLAEVQMRLHEFDSAGRSTKVVLDANPEDTDMRLLLAQTLIQRGQNAEGLKEAQAAADRDKDSPNPFLMMADVYQDLKRPADAEAMYRRALAVGKGQLKVYQALVRFLREANQQEKLKAYLAEAKKALPPDDYLMLAGTTEELETELKTRVAKEDAAVPDIISLARHYLNTDRTDEAKALLLRALGKAEPKSNEWRQAWQQLFQVYVAAGAYDKASDLIEQLKTAEPAAQELLLAGPLVNLNQNRLDEAIKELKAVSQSHKALSQAHYLLGVALNRQRKWDEAVAALTKAVEARPNLIPARLLLAQIYLTLGNYAGARTEANEALKFDARYVPALELKASAVAGLGLWDDAAAAREEIARVVPDSVNNLIALAALYLQRHTPQKAEQVFTRAYKLAPDNPLLVRGFADFYIETGRTKQGEAIVDDYVSRHPDDADEKKKAAAANAQVVRGEFTAKAYGPAEAEKYFRKAAELAKGDPGPLVFMGDQYMRVADLENAAKAYRDADAVAKDNVTPKKRLADVNMLQGKLEEAKGIIDQVMKAAPKDIAAMVIAGRIADRQGKTDAAKRYIEQALAVDPSYGEASVRLAEIYAGPDPLKALDILATVEPSDPAFEKAMLLRSDINTRRVLLTEAILDLRRLLQFRPTSVPGRMALAAKLMATQKAAQASEILVQLSKERMDQDPGLLAALGDSYYRQDRFADALAAYEKARALRPEFSEALVGEARSLVSLNRITEAIERIRKVMNQYPNEVWPRMALVAVYEKTNDLPKAFEALRTGLLRKEDWEQGYVYLADLLARNKQVDEARKYLLLGLSKVPTSIPIRAGLATLDIGIGRAADACKILQPLAEEFENQYKQTPEKLDRLRPYLAPVRIYSLALYSTGRTEEALKWGMMLWAIDPTDVANANNMAWVLATEKKDFIRATEMIQRCMRLVPNHPQVLDTAGWISFLNGRYDEAAEYLLSSIKYGDNAEARYHLGRVYEARERLDEARQEYEKALKMGLSTRDKADAEARLAKLTKPQK